MRKVKILSILLVLLFLCSDALCISLDEGRKLRFKSIQAGTVTISGENSTGTATISSVDVNNSILIYGGVLVGSEAHYEAGSRITLTNATTITATRKRFSGSYNTITSYTVIEFYPGTIKSIQRGYVFIDGNGGAETSATDTITAVDVNKAFVMSLGWYGDSTDDDTETSTHLVLTNSTTVTATVAVATTDDCYHQYQVVEFY